MGLSNQVLFEALLSKSSDKIYFKDTDSRFIVASNSMAKNFSVESADHLIGKTDSDFFSEEHARQALEDEQQVIKTGVAIHREAEKETWPDGTVTWASTIKAPILIGENKAIGVLGISRDVTKEKLAHDALERHDRLLKEQNDIMRADLENARMVQGILIPGKVRTSSFLLAAVAYEPSHSVSGDIVTFPRPDESAVRFFLGDVCGHGVSAGIYTILVKYLGDRLSRGEEDAVQSILTRMNNALKDVLPNRFVTAMNGIFEQTDEDSVRLTISHAAHPCFFIQRSSGDLKTIRLDPTPGLGLLPDSEYTSQDFLLTRGDRVILFTDGLEEALNENGEEFGLARLEGIVRTSQSKDPVKVPDFLLSQVQKYAGKAPRTDDQTCIVFHIQ